MNLFDLFFQGERLSHAVGCAFAVCLEKKQKRDREVSTASNQQIIHDILTTSPNKSGPNSVQQSPSSSASASASTSTSNFQRGGFRYASLQERRQDPQNVIVSGIFISDVLKISDTFFSGEKSLN